MSLRDERVVRLLRSVREVLQCRGPELVEEEDRATFGLYLQHVDDLLTRIAGGDPIEDRVLSIERLFGHTWVVDAIAYDELYGLWRDLREQLSRLLGGMTVIERLWALGLLDQFDGSCSLGRWSDAAHCLRAAEVGADDISAILSAKGLPNGWRA